MGAQIAHSPAFFDRYVKKILQYGRHLLRARGRHGTHSPFVYAFVEQVMRKRPRVALPRQDQFRPRAAALLYQTFCYLSPQVIYADLVLLDAVTALAAQALPGVPVLLLANGTAPAQALVIANISSALPDQMNNLLEHPVKILLVGPHAHKATERTWMQLAASPAVKVSIDYWHFGLLVNDQAFKARQHFRLR